jgi:hypothetical protein
VRSWSFQTRCTKKLFADARGASRYALCAASRIVVSDDYSARPSACSIWRAADRDHRAWTSYRKVEPPKWTPYFQQCVDILSQGRESTMDILLTMQIRCQQINNQLIWPSLGLLDENTDRQRAESANMALRAALLRNLDGIRNDLPAEVLNSGNAFTPILCTRLTALTVSS